MRELLKYFLGRFHVPYNKYCSSTLFIFYFHLPKLNKININKHLLVFTLKV